MAGKKPNQGSITVPGKKASKTPGAPGTEKPGKARRMVAKFPDPSEHAKAVARLALTPSSNAAAVVSEYAKPFGGQDMSALAEQLSGDIVKVQGGDMGKCEAMLMGQAEALQSIFMNFSRRALVQDYQAHLESFFRMALKAQNQCRMTLETLAMIKNPPVVFAKQANIAHGHQQVNNGAPPHQQAPAREEKEITSNELLEDHHGERLDTRAAQTAGRKHP